MKTKEIQFLEENIFNLIKHNKKVEIEVILDYLDYVNKVRYSEKDINPILDKLILEKRIVLIGDNYSVFPAPASL